MGPRPPEDAPQGQKGPSGPRLSNELALLFAQKLRPEFPGILPAADGSGQESRARTAKGFKKLDVNYSTVELGLALGLSIKTINFRDPGTHRYTKNYTRIDAELRAEAMDYHERQPYAVLIGLLFLPIDACDDAAESDRVSSFGAAVQYFRNRAGRRLPSDAPDLFERFHIALHGPAGDDGELARFYDVERPRPPRARRPARLEAVSLGQLLASVRDTYDARNNAPLEWADD